MPPPNWWCPPLHCHASPHRVVHGDGGGEVPGFFFCLTHRCHSFLTCDLDLQGSAEMLKSQVWAGKDNCKETHLGNSSYTGRNPQSLHSNKAPNIWKRQTTERMNLIKQYDYVHTTQQRTDEWLCMLFSLTANGLGSRNPIQMHARPRSTEQSTHFRQPFRGRSYSSTPQP